MKPFIKAAFAASMLITPAAISSAAYASEPAPALAYEPWPGEELEAETRENIDAYLASLTPLWGEVELKSANATLNIPQSHYFLAAEDAQSVLEEAWGNPPDDKVLGMIFPAGQSPLDQGVWGATVSYIDDGYVSDKDAQKIDYDKMMRDLQKQQVNDNEWRAENGYEPIDMIGWAETPSYNPDSHKLYWAKEMKFGEAESNTLNYDIRALGRRGTLVISFIASMEQLDKIRQTTPAVLEMAHFNPGATYGDYQPGVDKKAAYGIAGLIGGAAIAKKTGLLTAILLFGKKFIVFIIAGLVALGGAVMRFFTGNK